MDKINISNLKTFFELRKTKSLAKRICIGRLFEHEEKFGLADSSGFLWPVFFETKGKKTVGDVLVFHGEFQYLKTDITNKKYDDIHYSLFIEEILQKISCQETWENSIIPNPIPNLTEYSLKNKDFTTYYKSETKKRFQRIQKRIQCLERVKQFFLNRNFALMETPTLVPSGGCEVYLNPFQTNYIDHRLKQIPLQLPTSPEFALKKMLAELPDKIFQISRSFRNSGELSQWHEPEFFLLEWYRTNALLKDIIQDTQNLVLSIADFLGSHLDIPRSWPRFRVDELFLKLMNLDLNELQKTEDFYKAAKPLSISIVKTDDWNDIFCKLFMEKIEPFLKEQKACFVTHYPMQMAALACVEITKSGEKTNFVERVEAYLDGIEICNGYLELVDAKVLEKRVQQTKKIRPELMVDTMFQNAMEFGLPPCAGNALGLERVIALLLGEKNIANLIPIPFLSQFKEGTIAQD